MKANNNLHIYIKVPELVSNISWRLNQTTIIADWEVSTGIMILMVLMILVLIILHQPPSPTHPPVLYYTVTHNVRQ